MEIVFRSLIIFFFLWLVTRAVGRSSLGELSTFQLLLYVTMGDLVQQGIDTLADIDLAVLETDGRVSVFTRSGQHEGAPETAPS